MGAVYKTIGYRRAGKNAIYVYRKVLGKRTFLGFTCVQLTDKIFSE